jgi:hypothetical protein
VRRLSEKKLIELLFECYRELYRNASPRADFDALVLSGISKKSSWYNLYYVSHDTLTEIVSKYEKIIPGQFDRTRFLTEVYLGSSPTERFRWYNWILGYVINLYARVFYGGQTFNATREVEC